MAEKKIDRRVKRTRNLLLESLTKLLEEKDLKDITVKEISDRADLNRGTFYLHYKDVFDMMDQLQKSLFDEIDEILSTCEPTGNNDSPKGVLLKIFTLLDENRAFCKVLMGPHGDYPFIMSLRNLVKSHIGLVWDKNHFHADMFEYYYAHCISGIIGLIQYWLESDSKKTPEEMTELVTQVVQEEINIFSNSLAKNNK